MRKRNCFRLGIIGLFLFCMILTGCSATSLFSGKKEQADQSGEESGQPKDEIIGTDSEGAGYDSGQGSGSGIVEGGGELENIETDEEASADPGDEEETSGKKSIFDVFKSGSDDKKEEKTAAGDGNKKVLKKITALASDYEFYYDRLDEKGQTLYREIYAGLSGMGTAYLSFLDEELTDEVYEYVKADHPELFYCRGYRITWKESFSKITDVELWGDFSMGEDQVLEYADKIKKRSDEILAYVPAGGDYEKIKYLHDYIVKHTDYTLDTEENQNIISVLLEGKSVCSGYTKTLQFLLGQAGVEAAYVWGKARGSGGGSELHSWNLVCADGDWYYVDVTFDDPTVTGTGEDKSTLQYTFFCVTSEELGRTHEALHPEYLPNCTATADNYFVREGRMLESYDPVKLQVIFDGANAGGAESVTFRCKNGAVYREVKQKLIDEKEMFRYMGGRERVGYQADDAMYIFVFWL